MRGNRSRHRSRNTKSKSLHDDLLLAAASTPAAPDTADPINDEKAKLEMSHMMLLREVWESGDDLMELILLHLPRDHFLYQHRIVLMLTSKRMRRLAWLTVTSLTRRTKHVHAQLAFALPTAVLNHAEVAATWDPVGGIRHDEAFLPHAVLQICPRLKVLRLPGSRLESLQGLPSSIQSLDLSSCNKLTDIAPLRGLANLKILDFGCCAKLEDLGPAFQIRSNQHHDNNDEGDNPLGTVSSFGLASSLTFLDIQGTSVEDISPLRSCLGLKGLILEKCKVKSLDPLSRCTTLTSLNAACTMIEDLSALLALPNLISILAPATPLKSIECMSSFACKATLEMLCLSCTDIEDVDSLHGFRNLIKLFLGSTLIRSLGSLRSCTKLMCLDIIGTGIEHLQADVPPLSCLKRLQLLNYSQEHQGLLQPCKSLALSSRT